MSYQPSETDEIPAFTEDELKKSPSLKFLAEHKKVTFTLMTLPVFNYTKIIRYLTVLERLRLFALVNSRFHDYVLQPQCFLDMSFFPIDDESIYAPKILSVTGTAGITYVEVNIKSVHPFVRKVASVAGMWNFRAELWNKLHWPTKLCIESLQLTLDGLSAFDVLRLDEAPELEEEVPKPNEEKSVFNFDSEPQCLSRDNSCSEVGASTPLNIKTPKCGPVAMDDENSNEGSYGFLDPSPASKWSFSQSVSLSPLKSNRSMSNIERLRQQYKMRNLFFIRFDTESYGPTVYFPRTLHGLGLQGFSGSVFACDWWNKQVQIEHRFHQLRFLVLAQCEFKENELQTLLKHTPKLEHLSLRYVRWDGVLVFPESLLSLGYFPDTGADNSYSFHKCKKLFQIQTRLNENCAASILFLNTVRFLPSIRRVSFEYIRQHQRWLPDIDLQSAEKWEDPPEDLTIVIAPEDLALHSKISEIFPIPTDRFIPKEHASFLDCNLWSEEAMEFIHMTKERKLLLR